MITLRTNTTDTELNNTVIFSVAVVQYDTPNWFAIYSQTVYEQYGEHRINWNLFI